MPSHWQWRRHRDPRYAPEDVYESPCCGAVMDTTDATCPDCKEPCEPELREEDDDDDYDCEHGGDSPED